MQNHENCRSFAPEYIYILYIYIIYIYYILYILYILYIYIYIYTCGRFGMKGRSHSCLLENAYLHNVYIICIYIYIYTYIHIYIEVFKPYLN